MPKSLLKKAKILAAIEDKSLSKLLSESLQERVSKSNGYKKARTRQVRVLKKGLNLGTRASLSFSREDLHER